MPPEFRPGDPLTAGSLNDLRAAAVAAARHALGAGLSGSGGAMTLDGRYAPFLAVLSGNASPYDFTEVGGGRTGAAYEVNGVPGLDGQTHWIRPNALDYRFAANRDGVRPPPHPPTTCWLVRGCNGLPLEGATVTVTRTGEEDPVDSGDTDADGRWCTDLAEVGDHITVTPPAGSGLSSFSGTLTAVWYGNTIEVSTCPPDATHTCCARRDCVLPSGSIEVSGTDWALTLPAVCAAGCGVELFCHQTTGTGEWVACAYPSQPVGPGRSGQDYGYLRPGPGPAYASYAVYLDGRGNGSVTKQTSAWPIHAYRYAQSIGKTPCELMPGWESSPSYAAWWAAQSTTDRRTLYMAVQGTCAEEAIGPYGTPFYLTYPVDFACVDGVPTITCPSPAFLVTPYSRTVTLNVHKTKAFTYDPTCGEPISATVVFSDEDTFRVGSFQTEGVYTVVGFGETVTITEIAP